MEGLEQQHVKEVYETIAGHFSETRYKAWPIVDFFFKDLPTRSVGLDVGCGNGKNMVIRPDISCIGFDLYQNEYHNMCVFLCVFRCMGLLEIVRDKGLEAVYGNMLSLPFRDESFVKFCNFSLFN